MFFPHTPIPNLLPPPVEFICASNRKEKRLLKRAKMTEDMIDRTEGKPLNNNLAYPRTDLALLRHLFFKKLS